jgi:hypothetical protein
MSGSGFASQARVTLTSWAFRIVVRKKKTRYLMGNTFLRRK